MEDFEFDGGLGSQRSVSVRRRTAQNGPLRFDQGHAVANADVVGKSKRVRLHDGLWIAGHIGKVHCRTARTGIEDRILEAAYRAVDMSEKHAANAPGMESQKLVELLPVLDPHRPIDPLAIQLDGWIMQKNRPTAIGLDQKPSDGFELPGA
jgi:hypothetical protein